MTSSSLEYNKVVIVDENDNNVGAEFLFDALEKDLIRKVSRVFVFDEAGNILLQRRGEKVRKPGLLDQSVGGHVDEGEDYLTAAKREMKEEIGLTGYELEEVVLSWRFKNLFNAIYKATVPAGTEINYDTEEVSEIIWMTAKEMDELVVKEPEKCTDSLVEIWQQFRDELTK